MASRVINAAADYRDSSAFRRCHLYRRRLALTGSGVSRDQMTESSNRRAPPSARPAHRLQTGVFAQRCASPLMREAAAWSARFGVAIAGSLRGFMGWNRSLIFRFSWFQLADGSKARGRRPRVTTRVGRHATVGASRRTRFSPRLLLALSLDGTTIDVARLSRIAVSPQARLGILWKRTARRRPGSI